MAQNKEAITATIEQVNKFIDNINEGLTDFEVKVKVSIIPKKLAKH